jgi:hypothetical protein
MIITTAESVLDLRISAPSWVNDRSVLCTPALVHFDAVAGFLQFHTACAGSRNTWTQTVVYNDWGSIVTIKDPNTWGPLEPETEEERAERERIEEESAIVGDEPWEEVKAKFPELTNMDVQVHCDCPAFLWWGSWYNLEQRDTSLFPEGIPFPHVRDPALNNVICKHLAAVFAQHF